MSRPNGRRSSRPGLRAEMEASTEMLRRAGAYNRSLIEASLDPLVTIGPDGKITDVNAATEAVTGRTRKKLIGTDFSDYFTEPARARAGYRQVFEAGFVRDYPLEIRHRTGRVTPVLYNATVYRDGAGNTVGVFAAARDVTELRRAEQAVRAERRRLKDVLEMLPAYLVLLTPDHHVPFANRFFRERFGESHGRRCFEYLFHRTAPCEVCETHKVLETMMPLEWKWTGPDGHDYEVYDFPFTDTDGSTLIMEVGLDITERKRAESALKEANETLEQRVAERTQAVHDRENELRLVTNAVPALMAYIDADFRYRWVNQGYERWFGLPAREVEGRRVRDVLGRKAWEIVRPYLERARAGEVVTYEEWMPYRWGEPRCVCVTCVPDRDEPGHVRGFVVHVTDVTARQQAEEALRCAHESLQKQSEELAAANKVLRTQSEELASANEELQAQSGELQAQSVQLQETGRRLRLALEAGGMGHWEWNLQEDSLSWCERFRELLDMNPSAPGIVESFLRCVHPDDRETMKKLAARTLVEPADFQVDFRVRRHRQDVRGEVAWLTSRGRVIRDEHGRGVRMIGVLYDVTHRKQMEEWLRRLNDQLEEEVQAQTEELRHTIERLQDEVVRRVLAEGKLRRRSQMLEGFFQHTIGPLAFLDRQCNFVRVNEAYARAEGRTPRELVGQSYFALHPDQEDQTIFLQVVRSKEPYRACARPCRYPGDPRVVTYWDWQLTPLLDERGQVQFLVFNLEDVTERQKAFQELEQRARQLQKLTLELAQAEDRERKRLAEILHDDLQQQLAAAKFHLGILSGHVRDDRTVQELAEQVSHMLKEAIAKSRSLSHELSPAVLYQSDLGETFEWLARQMEAKHGLRVYVEVRGRVSSQADVLKTFLYRSAQELLFNVIKHARVKEARLRLQRVRGRLWLTVSDQGPGFETPTLRRTAGFGLLGIRERVELLGGRMKIRSAKGRGSTFLIAVPELTAPAGAGVSDAPSEAPPAAGRAELPTATPPEQRLHVLLVDDHEVVREGLAALLAEQTDIEVVGQAGNGREAVDLAHQLRPEVVIMDVAMPVMAGDEATRQIKLSLPGIRVIALSMFEEPEMAERMRRAGAVAYLLKTGPSEDLLAAIRGRPKA